MNLSWLKKRLNVREFLLMHVRRVEVRLYSFVMTRMASRLESIHSTEMNTLATALHKWRYEGTTL